MDGGIIEYARQVEKLGIPNKFIGKNFVFDHRLGERITDDVVSQCHQCGKPCDNHTNCENEGCHLLFIQCDVCKAVMENCCSTECQEIIHLTLDQQVKLRRGTTNGNMIFRKGKSDKLKFKHSGELSDTPLAVAHKPKAIRQKNKIKKVLLGKAQHYFTKANVAQFFIENNALKNGDRIMISGPSTGNELLTLENLFVNGKANDQASIGDKVTFEVPFRVRLSDKLYKIVE